MRLFGLLARRQGGAICPMLLAVALFWQAAFGSALAIRLESVATTTHSICRGDLPSSAEPGQSPADPDRGDAHEHCFLCASGQVLLLPQAAMPLPTRAAMADASPTLAHEEAPHRAFTAYASRAPPG